MKPGEYTISEFIGDDQCFIVWIDKEATKQFLFSAMFLQSMSDTVYPLDSGDEYGFDEDDRGYIVDNKYKKEVLTILQKKFGYREAK